MAHTPGPWRVYDDGGDREEYGTCGTHIMAMGEPDRETYIVCERVDLPDDACLIAAAPDLLTELRETLRDLTEWDGSSDAMEVIKANIAAAIAKAEGR